MFVCDRCGKSLIDIVDLLLLFLIAVNLVFGALTLIDGNWFGVGSFFLALLFGTAFIIRRRECKVCRAQRAIPETPN